MIMITKFCTQTHLECAILPSLLRVPSGKKKTEAPFLIRSMHRLRQSYMLRSKQNHDFKVIGII